MLVFNRGGYCILAVNMWYDVVENITDSKTYIIAVHDGSYFSVRKLMCLKEILLKANIDAVEILSSRTVVGSQIAQTYALPGAGGLMLLRPNKQVAWSWLGLDVPGVSELICRFNEVG